MLIAKVEIHEDKGNYRVLVNDYEGGSDMTALVDPKRCDLLVTGIAAVLSGTLTSGGILEDLD